MRIPQLGFGVYQSAPGQETESAVRHALKVGYRHIDTAQFYRNEADVGNAVRASGLARADVFVTTKVANPNHGYESTLKSVDRSLAQAGFDYFDLILIHFPTPRRHDAWRALKDLQQAGKARMIGVSNYTVRHLREMDDAPPVNQVEMSPFLQQRELVAYCRDHGIAIEAYSPLTQGRKLNHPALQVPGRTPAQVILKWALQRDLIVLPKSVTPARIEENARLDFTLDDTTMARLDGLDEDFRTCWDPTNAP